MKINFRTQEELQRKIDRHLLSIKLAGTLFYDGTQGGKPRGGGPRRKEAWSKDVWGKLRHVYDAVAVTDHPVDYRYVCQALGWPNDASHHWKVSGRLSLLTSRGFLRVTGRGELRYRWKKGALLYVAVPPEDIPIVRGRVERAIARMLADIEEYSYLANEVPQCLARRVEENDRNGNKPRMYGGEDQSERNREIVQLRLGGMKLEEIGAKFGMTRERARQIVERAVIGRDARHAQTMERAHRMPLVKARDWPEAAEELQLEQMALDIINKATSDNR